MIVHFKLFIYELFRINIIAKVIIDLVNQQIIRNNTALTEIV